MGVIRGGLPGQDTATVTPEGTKDRFGDPTAPGSSWTVKGCWISPIETSSDEFRATTNVTQWKLYAPAGSRFPVGATVVVAGITARVSGPLEPWADSGVAVPLATVTG